MTKLWNVLRWGAAAALALAVAWSVWRYVPLPKRDDAPPAAQVTLPPVPQPPPSPPAASTAPPLAAPAPPPSVAAVPPPAAMPAPPAPPPEPLIVDKRTIARVQFFLEQLGYQIGVADGVMGRRTKVAIAAFRKTNALGQGEEIDGPLFDALDAAVKQLPPKNVEGVPSAAPRSPVERVPLSN